MMASRRTEIVKVGGSLFTWPGLGAALTQWLSTRAASGAGGLLIPGGGALVEALREIDRVHGLGESVSHRLALHTMEVTAGVLEAIDPRLRTIDHPDRFQTSSDGTPWAILRVRDWLESAEHAGAIPASWVVTSDSIAAYVASHVGASRLTLLKSVALPRNISRLDAARYGLVDPYFPVAASAVQSVSWVDLRTGGQVELTECEHSASL